MGNCSSNPVASIQPQVERRKAFDSNGHFEYQKDTCALENWEPLKKVGDGSLSTIHLVRRRKHRVNVPYQEQRDIMSLSKPNDGNIESDEGVFALKSIIKGHVRNKVALEEIRNEIYTMSHLEHPNIATIHEAYERKRHIYMIMDYCRGGDLSDRSFTEAQAAAVLSQILSAVAYLHKHNVVHRDLKLENIMFDRPGSEAKVKIIDFGLATRYISDGHRQMTEKVGTLYSMSPQVLQGVYDSKCDLWSIGVIAYALLSGGKLPFWGPPKKMRWSRRRRMIVDRIMSSSYSMNGPRWEGVSIEAKKFVSSLLQMDPTNRPTAKEALSSPWIQKYKDEQIQMSPMMLLLPPKNSKNQQLKPKAAAVGVAVTQPSHALLASKLSKEDILTMKIKFEQMDQKGRGEVTLSEFGRVLASSRLSKTDRAAVQASLSSAPKINYMALICNTLEHSGYECKHDNCDNRETKPVTG